MEYKSYLIAVLLIICWTIGFFLLSAFVGVVVHVLLIFALVLIITTVIKQDSNPEKEN